MMTVATLRAPVAPGFRDPVAVEAWDACFRWREGAALRDATIGATWTRVARSVARDGEHDTFVRELHDALSWLRLLPDPRAIARLGTAVALPPAAAEVAVVNAAAFVRDPFGERARLDVAGIESTAGLAVRLLDRLRPRGRDTVPALRIGLVGVADALARLGLGYDSTAGRDEAGRIAAALAHGALEASLAAVAAGAPAVQRHSAARAMAAELRHRPTAHAALTAIASHPQLALLADNVADALDPRDWLPRNYRMAALGGERAVRSAGGSVALARELGATLPAAGAWPPDRAQLAMRAAVAPWIDAPIELPLATSPGQAELRLACEPIAERQEPDHA